MTAWELATIFGSLFALGLARGSTVCVSICVPGLLPYLAERPRSAADGARFGLLLCAPRLLIFAGIGLVWGAVSYAIFDSVEFEEAAGWLHVGGYMVLGLVIALLGLGMFLKAAREKEDIRQERLRGAMGEAGGEGEGGEGGEGGADDGDAGSSEDDEAGPPLPEGCPAPSIGRRRRVSRALTTVLLRFVPESDRSERAFVLLWGSVLGFACLLEVSVLEIGVLGGIAASTGSGTLAAALLGAGAMLAFAAGATVPVVVSASAFAAYVDRVSTRERLVSLRVTGSLVMVMIGGILFVRYLAIAIAL